MARWNILKKVREATLLIGRDAEMRMSNQDVPHIVVEIGGMTYSACYFANKGSWAIFWPHVVPAVKQTMVEVGASNSDLWDFFNQKRKEAAALEAEWPNDWDDDWNAPRRPIKNDVETVDIEW